ncbi:protein of unknown function [Cupriavidus neocaledonicus]|uniref:Uncharacterized protein n=1 Tax=Cupriavidus neocaledonicus TaxID=1040979 RepID=A0A375H3D8_9BURK|nr:protein of unknown function [Cupriavidus neocaledonicus]
MCNLSEQPADGGPELQVNNEIRDPDWVTRHRRLLDSALHVHSQVTAAGCPGFFTTGSSLSAECAHLGSR